ncbi:hypothetical protein RhiirA4_498593 [Rhizophagus irregularis]|uniref:Serine-threonine/tyrosine-protein kinase catalytic domain-containing protein n=1 Tax=Rhizophagus irregularis TaxID=588596 RepID=A0A2I1H332_9GLOM|nr:hypothetical protein RhiirA4_498593 [Rhizophagus irregularis]
MTSVKEWIEEEIKNKRIIILNIINLIKVKSTKFDRGAFGKLKLLRVVDYHQKINRILGITKDSEHYILVLEYANEGSLRDYLKKRFNSLKWNDKIQMHWILLMD